MRYLHKLPKLSTLMTVSVAGSTPRASFTKLAKAHGHIQQTVLDRSLPCASRNPMHARTRHLVLPRHHSHSVQVVHLINKVNIWIVESTLVTTIMLKLEANTLCTQKPRRVSRSASGSGFPFSSSQDPCACSHDAQCFFGSFQIWLAYFSI
jgi:hypothetical protein